MQYTIRQANGRHYKTIQDKKWQAKTDTRQDKTTQYKTRQSETKQCIHVKINQYKTSHDSTRENITLQDNLSQDTTRH